MNRIRLKKGDTIQCSDEQDMLRTHENLSRAGIYTEWLNISDNTDEKWKLTITGFDRGIRKWLKPKKNHQS